jgi:hypothetical protein
MDLQQFLTVTAAVLPNGLNKILPKFYTVASDLSEIWYRRTPPHGVE